MDHAALIVVDMQQGFDDPSWGRTANHPGCEENVARLLAAWQERELPVVVVRHDSAMPASPLAPGAAGNALIDDVAAVQPSLLVTKHVNSAFHGEPHLHRWLDQAGIGRIVVCGIQTNMCVETTARVGGNLGLDVTVPLDATRTFDLTGPDGRELSAEHLMQSTATNLHGGGFARVTTTDEAIAGR